MEKSTHEEYEKSIKTYYTLSFMLKEFPKNWVSITPIKLLGWVVLYKIRTKK
jgi:hypothetical protein